MSEPFGSADPVESRLVEAIPVGDPGAVPASVAFLDGIQRYAVEGRLGLQPIIRGHAAAATVLRVDGELDVLDHASDEFLVTAVQRLSDSQRAALEEVGLPMLDAGVADREHPMLDVRRAALLVERRRARLEAALVGRHVRQRDDTWLVVDGSLPRLENTGPRGRLVGLIKSHETQFLDGSDLRVALTLPEAHRTSVFRRSTPTHEDVYSWYLRLWPWEEQDLLHGLVRVERPAVDESVATATQVSRWLLAERTPLSAPDSRWDRLVYPIQQVEAFLRAQLGSWW